MSTGSVIIKGSTAASDAQRDWQDVRAADDIQYAPVSIPEPPKPPEWMKDLSAFFADIGKWLTDLFAPLGEFFGLSWPVFQNILIGLAVIGVLMIAWRIITPMVAARRLPKEAEETEWAPGQAAATALLEDADRLAAQGRFDEAAHLLLQRSVSQIAAERPDWLHPASTAREIANLAKLPDAARHAFGVIAQRVERSLFALRDLTVDDWQAARSAYAEFALQKFAR